MFVPPSYQVTREPRLVGSPLCDLADMQTRESAETLEGRTRDYALPFRCFSQKGHPFFLWILDPRLVIRPYPLLRSGEALILGAWKEKNRSVWRTCNVSHKTQ